MSAEINNPLFARFFHRFCGRDRGQGERELRIELLAGLRGRVVEVGAGNGINFEHYPDSVADVIAVEPEPYLRRQAEAAGASPGLGVCVRVVPGVADALELASGSVDAVVACGVLCTVPDQGGALREFRRVLRPGGELRFYEHVRSRRPAFARWQRAVDAWWPRLFGGCHTDRDTVAAIQRAGFRIEHCRGFPYPSAPGLYPVAPRVLGVAISA